jgi:hypothetical protein
MSWPEHYQKWRPSFASVIDPRYYSLAWLDGEVWSGRARFWGNDRAGLICELKTYPTGTCDVHALVAAGDFEEIADTLRPKAEDWGREHGAIGALIESRPAWGRALKTEGYEPHQLTVRKEL